MVKFSTFENTVNAMYRYVFTDAKSSYSMLTQLGITFVSGFFAGCLCAIVSHPGDTLVSIMNKPEYANSTKSTTQRMRQVVQEIGFRGLWYGLPPRIIMIGSIAGAQWYTFDSWKVFCGLQSSGNQTK